MEVIDTLHIAAPAPRLWELTLDVEAWPEHTPTVTSVRRLDEGPIAVGARAVVKQPGQAERVWTVTELVPERRFAWASTLVGVTMTGIHDLADLPDGGTVQTLTVRLEGRFARPLTLALRRPIARALAKENAGFAAAATAPMAA